MKFDPIVSAEEFEGLMTRSELLLNFPQDILDELSRLDRGGYESFISTLNLYNYDFTSGNKADFHVHSRYSDGVHTIPVLIDMAINEGLEFLLLADHDTFESQEPLVDYAGVYSLRIVPGVEVNTTDLDGTSIHVKGYFPGQDPTDLMRSDLGSIFDEVKKGRRVRVIEVVKRMNDLFAEYFIPEFREDRKMHGENLLRIDVEADLKPMSVNENYIVSNIALYLQNHLSELLVRDHDEYLDVAGAIVEMFEKLARDRLKAYNTNPSNETVSWGTFLAGQRGAEEYVINDTLGYNWRDLFRKQLFDHDEVLHVPLSCHVPNRGEYGRAMDTCAAIKMIQGMDGYSEIAHPKESYGDVVGLARELGRFKDAGLRSVEVYCPKNGFEMNEYKELAIANGLLRGLGSDFHGISRSGITLGQLGVDG